VSIVAAVVVGVRPRLLVGRGRCTWARRWGPAQRPRAAIGNCCQLVREGSLLIDSLIVSRVFV
jgi:hypothetical protein